MAEINSTIRLYDNFSGVMEHIVNAVNYSVSSMEQMRNALESPFDDSALRGARAATDNMNAAMRDIENAARGARNDMDNFSDTVETVENAAEQAERASRQFGDVLEETGNQGENAAPKITSATDSISNLLVAVGGYKVLGFIKDSFIEASSAAMEFESAITGVYKTVDGTQAQLQGLSDDVKEMALRIPASTTEIAGVMESAGQLGIETTAITGFTETMVNLGVATNLTSEAAASMLAKFANITGMDAGNYSKLGSVIVDLGNNFATTEADIVNMSSYLASAATLAGFAETDIMGLAAAMSSVGIEAEAGGSSMSKLITQMQVSVETGSDLLTDFASVANMTADQFSDTFRNNAVGALQAFIKGLNDVERNGKSASVILQEMDLDDIRLSNTIRALASSGDLMTNAVNTANRAWQENTALTNEADKRYGTLESKMQITRNAANNLKIEIGKSLNPVLEDLTGIAASALTGLTEFAKKNQTLTAGIMGTAGALGTLVSGFMTVAPAISPAMQIIDKLKDKCAAAGTSLGAMGGKIGLVVGGASLLIGVGTALWSHFASAEKEVADYNGTLQECAAELENARAQYISTVEAQGEASQAALDLKEHIDLLNAQYEKAGGTAADYAMRIEETAKAYNQLKTKYQEQINTIETTQTSGLTAISQLETLSEKAYKTGSDLDYMRSIAEKLNNDYKMNIIVDYNTGDVSGFDKNAATKAIIDEAAQNRKKALEGTLTGTEYQDNFINTLKNKIDAYNNMVQAADAYEKFKMENADKKNSVWSQTKSWYNEQNNAYLAKLNEETQNYNNALNEYDKMISDGKKMADEIGINYESYSNSLMQSKLKNKDFSDSVWLYEKFSGEKAFEHEELPDNRPITFDNGDIFAMENLIDGENIFNNVLSGNGSLADVFKAYKGIATNEAENIKEALTPEDIAGKAFQEYQKEIEDLAKVYAENCAAIRKNLDGMFDVLENVPEMDLSKTIPLVGDKETKSAVENIQSQTEYFRQYKSAVEALEFLKLDNNIIAQLSPEQAVAWADELREMSNAAGNIYGAADKVKEINDAYRELGDTKNEVTQNLGKLSVADELEQIKQDAEGKINELADKMNFEIDARRAAISTMNGYISEIMYAGDKAVEIAKGIAERISEALSISATANVNVKSSGNVIQIDDAEAAGTLSAPGGLTLVGEQGPELIWLNGGERVFNNDETNRILNNRPQVYIPNGIEELLAVNRHLESRIQPEITVNIPAINIDLTRQFDKLADRYKPADYYTENLPKDDDDKPNISDDDLKYLKELAERETINKIYSPEIKIEMTNNNNISSEMDIDGVIDKIIKGVEEGVEIGAEGVHT